jgi:hypothetical protein
VDADAADRHRGQVARPFCDRSQMNIVRHVRRHALSTS